MGGFGLEVEDFGLAQGGQQAIAKSAKYIAGGLENLLRNVQLQVGQGRVPSFTPALRLHSAACAVFNASMNKARFKLVNTGTCVFIVQAQGRTRCVCLCLRCAWAPSQQQGGRSCCLGPCALAQLRQVGGQSRAA